MTRKLRASSKPLDLELVQRDFLGLIDEPMDFNEKTLAQCLRDMLHEVNPEFRFFIRAIADALDNAESDWRLTLLRSKKGRWETIDVTTARGQRNYEMVYLLGHYEGEGMKTEAAIAEIMAKYGLSRSAVFRGIKSAQESLEMTARLFGPSDNERNPRPPKS